MKKVKFLFLILFAFGLAILINGCQKSDNESDNDLQTSQDDTRAEFLWDDVQTTGDEAAELLVTQFKNSDGILSKLEPCATVTIDTTVDPKKMTIDFGTEDCLCNDGNYRRGKILISFTGRYHQPGAVIITTFDNYFINYNQMLGTQTFTNHGKNENNHTWHSTEIDGTIIFSEQFGGGTLTWTSQNTREWIEGENTPRFRGDDVFLILGSSQGLRPNGNTFSKTITSALRREIGCRHFVSGTVELIHEGKPTRILDYGEGACDNLATFTINGVTRTIVLP